MTQNSNNSDQKIEKFKEWMRDNLIARHKINTEKLIDPAEFSINHFLLPYLANFLTGKSDYKSLAKALVYPRVLGTSITTSFGGAVQNILTEVFDEINGSAISGIDIEFKDQIDGRHKYAQIKAGPNVLNSDDVVTIDNHFSSLRNIARTNNRDVRIDDMLFCLLYGERDEVSGNILNVQNRYKVYVGEEFWHHLTGDKDFYSKLIKAMSEVAEEVDMKETIERVIEELAVNIEKEYGDRYSKADLEE